MAFSGFLLSTFGFWRRGRDLAEVFQAVGDGEGAVGFALLAHPIRPEGKGEVRPVVIATLQILPAGLQVLAPLRQAEEFPERAGGDEHAVVQVRFPGELDHALDFGAHFQEISFQINQCLKAGSLAGLLAKILDLRAHRFELWIKKIGQDCVQGLFVQPVVVEPNGVAAAGSGERPIDGGLAAALRVAFQVIGEKAAWALKPFAKVGYAEQYTGFVF